MALWLKAADNKHDKSEHKVIFVLWAELYHSSQNTINQLPFGVGSAQFTLCENVPGQTVWTKLKRIATVFGQLLLTSFFLEPGCVGADDTTGKRGQNLCHREQTSCILLPCDISKKLSNKTGKSKTSKTEQSGLST